MPASSTQSIVSFIFNSVFLNAANIIDDNFNIRQNWSPVDEQDSLNPHQVQRTLFTIALFLAHVIPFYLLNFIFQILVDTIPMSKLAPYRFNGTKMPPTKLIFQAILLTTVYNIIAPIFVFRFGFDLIHRKNPQVMSQEALPSSIFAFLFQLFVCYMTTDFAFYWTHRALHEIPFAYEKIHKQHHRFIISVGWAATYAHPVEFIFGNVVPVTLACFLFNFHAVVWFSWVALALFGTTLAHSGFKHYDLFDGGVKGSQIHDFHHTHQVSNYGHSLMWDRICGTDVAWKKYWLNKRITKNTNDNSHQNEKEEDPAAATALDFKSAASDYVREQVLSVTLKRAQQVLSSSSLSTTKPNSDHHDGSSSSPIKSSSSTKRTRSGGSSHSSSSKKKPATSSSTRKRSLSAKKKKK